MSDNSSKNSTIFGIERKKFVDIVMASILIILGITSAIIAVTVSLELNSEDGIYSQKPLDDITQKKLEDKRAELLTEMLFAIVFIGWGVALLKSSFSKTKKISIKISIKKPKTKESSQKTPTIRIFIFIILVQSLFSILLIFSGTVIQIINSSIENIQITFADLFFYGLMGSFTFSMIGYVGKWRRVESERYFEIFGTYYIIKERSMLVKIKIVSFFLLVITTSILFVYEFSKDPSFTLDSITELELILFSIIIGTVLINFFTTMKINEDSRKMHFQQLLISGCFQQAMTSVKKDQLYYLKYGLNMYDDFLKQTHKLKFTNTQKIIVEIQSLGWNVQNAIYQLSKSFDSHDDYSLLNKISLLSKKNTSDLLIPDTFIHKFKEWGLIVIPLSVGIFTSMLTVLIPFLERSLS